MGSNFTSTTEDEKFKLSKGSKLIVQKAELRKINTNIKSCAMKVEDEENSDWVRSSSNSGSLLVP
jgi:hypothetical protein